MREARHNPQRCGKDHELMDEVRRMRCHAHRRLQDSEQQSRCQGRRSNHQESRMMPCVCFTRIGVMWQWFNTVALHHRFVYKQCQSRPLYPPSHKPLPLRGAPVPPETSARWRIAQSSDGRTLVGITAATAGLTASRACLMMLLHATARSWHAKLCRVREYHGS